MTDEGKEALPMAQAVDVFSDVALEHMRRMIGVPCAASSPITR